MTQVFNLSVLVCTLTLFVSCKENTSNESKETNTWNPVSNVQILSNPSEVNSQVPRLFGTEDALYVSWITTTDTVSSLHYASYQNERWSDVHTVAEGSDWFVNWADFPAISANKETILTSHLQKSADETYSYDVKLNLFRNHLPSPAVDSTKRNVQFIKEDFILHNDGTKSEHGFVSMMPYQEDSFFVTWLDGRHTVGNSHANHEHQTDGGAMTLRSAVVPATGEIAQ
ncbi:MAG: hypothetical protein R3359_02265, partial [Marinirhabdus sp.]|nr:hypothetical protein [Marinirhabdus sp.]